MDTTFNSVSLLLNMLLLYLILNYSTFKEKTYKHMLTVSCLLDATLSIITFVSQPVRISL